MRLFPLRVVLALIVGNASAAHAPPPDLIYLAPGARMMVANKMILKDGWIPDPARITRTYPMTGVRKQIHDRGVTAIEDCASELSTCTFKYRRHNACLHVFAKGESLRQMKISAWDKDCEPES